MTDCPLCHTALDGATVPFGFFEAHAGCYGDWVHENRWIEQDRLDSLESQEW